MRSWTLMRWTLPTREERAFLKFIRTFKRSFVLTCLVALRSLLLKIEALRGSEVLCSVRAAAVRKFRLLCNYFHLHPPQMIFCMCSDAQSSYSQNTCSPPSSCRWMCFAGSLQDKWLVSVRHYSAWLSEPKGRTCRTAEINPWPA